jgi:hypothetical protein
VERRGCAVEVDRKSSPFDELLLYKANSDIEWLLQKPRSYDYTLC